MRRIATGEIGRRELLAMLVIFSGSDVFLSYPQYVATIGAEASWMIPVLSTLILTVLFVALWRVWPILRENGIVEIGLNTFGSVIGGLFALLYAGLFVWKAASNTRQFAETIVTTVLPRTPLSVVTICFLLVAAYYAHAGLEGISRVSFIAGPCLLIGTVALVGFSSTWSRMEFLLPLWGNGVGSVLRGGAVGTSSFLNVFLMLIAYPALQSKKAGEMRKVALWTIVMTGLILAGVQLVYLTVFSSSGADSIPFPLYQLSRLVYLGRFFQRMESLFVFFWVASTILKVAICLWIAAYAFAQGFRMPVYRPIVASVTLLTYAVSFAAPSFIVALKWDSNYIENYGWIISIALPVAVILVAYVRSKSPRKGGHRHRTGSTRTRALKGAV